jgi:hypothetical protein
MDNFLLATMIAEFSNSIWNNISLRCARDNHYLIRRYRYRLNG